MDKTARFVANLLLGQFPLPLPGWLLLILAIYISVPDWNARNQYWFSVAKSSGGLVSLVASVVLWPYFAPVLALIGLTYIIATARPSIAPTHHPIVAAIGWIAFVVCFLAVV